MMEENDQTTVYIKRKNHTLLNESEIDELSNNMKELRNGKPVFWSEIEITPDKPNSEFTNKTFGTKRRRRSSYQQEIGPYSCKPYVSNKISKFKLKICLIIAFKISQFYFNCSMVVLHH